MKAILRKGMAACAAVLMGANVMAQSFDLTKEFGKTDEGVLTNAIISSLTKDSQPRLLITESDEGRGSKYDPETGRYTYVYTMDKLLILDNGFNVEKEFTSGPLFDEYIDVTVEAAAKTLKIESVDTVYSGEEAIREFYRSFDEPNYPSGNGKSMYEQMIEKCTEEQINAYVEKYIARMFDVDTIFNGERFLFRNYYDVEKSNYFEWGNQYPYTGWIYKDHDELYKVEYNYVPDELEEISRYNSNVYNAFYKNQIEYFSFDESVEDVPSTISQNLFNDDDNYEFLLPELALFQTSSYNYYTGLKTIRYEYLNIGYKIVSEDGTVLHRLLINEGKDNDIRCYAEVVGLGDKFYLLVSSEKVDENGNDTDEVTSFYEIKKDGSGIQKVREVRGGMNIRPTLADRDAQITITLDDESNVARELIITGVNGQLVERRAIPAGENTVQVSAAMMRSGMYNFTLQKKGEIVDNGKVIVK